MAKHIETKARVVVSIQLACFFLLPSLEFSVVTGNIFGVFILLILGYVCSFLYGYVQTRGLVWFRDYSRKDMR